jgi:DNA-binding transcriptional LysR family regulator
VNDLGLDLELRLVRYFTVVAQHSNFTRAASDLHVAQPALSRQIRRLEQHLGVSLFERTARGTVLTEAGEAFLPEAQALLRGARRAVLTARAHAATGKLIVGYVEDLTVTAAVGELRRRHPGAQVGTRHLECHEEGALVEAGVDVLVARAPLFVSADDVQVTVLYEEPRVLLVRADHHLAQRNSVTVEDFAGDENVLCPHGGPRVIYPTDYYQWSDPGPISVGPVSESSEDRIELVASGQAVAVVPIGDRRSSLRTDLVTVPVEGVAASRVVVATRIGDVNPLVADFVDAAGTHLVGADVTRAAGFGRR